MYLPPRKWMAFLAAYFLLLASTCEEKTDIGVLPEDVTKSQREELGAVLHTAILQSPNDFPILDRSMKGDSVILQYLQTLYDQVTFEIRLDRTSPATNSWTRDRPWLVTVLDDRDRYAFSLPGGYFYISTGFLKSINKGHEIYYLMAFEAANIHDGFLLENLSSKYSASMLLDLVNQPAIFSPAALEEMLAYLKQEIDYEATVVQEIDEAAAHLICGSSIFDRFGIVTLLELLHSREQWRDTRPSYADRLAYLMALRVEGCGDIKATGAYHRMVLDNLE